MRRFVFFFALAFAFGIGLTLVFPNSMPKLLRHAPLVILITVYAVFVARYFAKPLVICLLIGIAAGSLYASAYHKIVVEPVSTLTGHTVLIEAEVRAEPDIYDNNQRAEVKIISDSAGIDSLFPTFSAIGYLPLTETPLTPGDKVSVLVSFYEPTARQGFDRQRYQMSNGNFISFSYQKDPDTKEPAQFSVQKADHIPLYYRPQAWARQFGNQILQALPDREAGFLYALLLGNRTYLDPIDQQNLQKVGLSHIIAVSGMHLMFLIGLIHRLFSRKIGVPLSFIVILIFIPMAGSSPSIIRAGIMASLSGIAFLFGREADSQTSLGAALVLLLALNPYSLFSLSLQLSFLSTFGILRYASRMEHTLFGAWYTHTSNPILRKLSETAGATVSCSLCATLFTTPVLVSTFGYITLLSLPSNLLTLSVISLIFSLGVFFCLLPFASGLLAGILRPLIDFVFWCAQTLGQWHWGILYWEETSGKIAVGATLLLIFLILAHRYIKPKITIPICCCVLIGATGYAHFVHANTTRVTLYAVGDGQMISIADGYNTLSLIDCGCAANQDSLQILRESMNWYGFSELDTILLTAVDKGHARNIAGILDSIPTRKLIIPANVRESETLEELTAAVARSGVPLTVWDGEAVDFPGLAQTTVLGTIDRKLGVHLQDGTLDLLILHSMTQNMLSELLEQSPVQAQQVILANQFEKQEQLEQALNIMQPQEILLSSGYTSVQTLFGVPVRSTLDTGDIVWSIPHI